MERVKHNPLLLNQTPSLNLSLKLKVKVCLLQIKKLYIIYAAGFVELIINKKRL